jgi:hypothetical protein
VLRDAVALVRERQPASLAAWELGIAVQHQLVGAQAPAPASRWSSSTTSV